MEIKKTDGMSNFFYRLSTKEYFFLKGLIRNNETKGREEGENFALVLCHGIRVKA